MIIPFKNVLVNLRFLEERSNVLFHCIWFLYKYFPYHQETQDIRSTVNTVTHCQIQFTLSLMTREEILFSAECLDWFVFENPGCSEAPQWVWLNYIEQVNWNCRQHSLTQTTTKSFNRTSTKCQSTLHGGTQG